MRTANKALYRTSIPLRSIAASEIGSYIDLYQYLLIED